MKRLSILFISLLLLAGCGRAVEAPTEPTAAITTTEAPTTEPIETTLQTPAAKPFTKDDITAIEANFKTVGDYVKAVPAAWYEVNVWWAMDSEIIVKFYNHKPEENSMPFLYLMSLDYVPGYSDSYDENGNCVIEYERLAQKLPKSLLDAKKVEIHSIDFAKTGSAILPPRGIKVGDPAQKIFDSYPDYRTGDSDVLYDITKLYPGSKLEWGVWDGEGWGNIDFMGGGIMENGVGFAYAGQPWDWDDRESDYTWLNMYNPRYLLTYQTKDDIITGIDYMLLYHPG